MLSRLIYTRILYPSSKLSSFNVSKRFIEQPFFKPQHIYRALEVISTVVSELRNMNFLEIPY